MTDSNEEPSSGEARVTLHWLNGSRAQSILWLLEELHVPYELDIYHRKPNLAAPPELQRLHPLGKSPLVTIHPPEDEQAQPIVLAESGFIMQYLSEHWSAGKDATRSMLPPRWKEGREGKVGGETKAWMRYQYILYFVEGTLMPYFWMYLILSIIKGPRTPFFIRPIAAMIVSRIVEALIFPNVTKNFTLLESYLNDDVGGDYLCGNHLTAADMLVLYPLLSMRETGALPTLGPWEKGTPEETYPKLFEYISRLEAEPGYKRAADKIRQLEGDFHVAPQMG